MMKLFTNCIAKYVARMRQAHAIEFRRGEHAGFEQRFLPGKLELGEFRGGARLLEPRTDRTFAAKLRQAVP